MANRKNEAVKVKGPVSVFSVLLLILIISVFAFLILIQNVDRFSDYFGGTTLKIITAVALLLLIGLFGAYIIQRGLEYRKNLERMVERLQKSNDLLQVLNNIQSTANATLDAQVLLEQVLDEVMPITSSLGTIYLINEETSRLRPRASYGTDTPLADLPDFPIGEGIVGKVAQSGEPLMDRASAGQGAGGSPPMTRLALPIKAGNKVMGVMVTGTTKGDYSEEEVTLLHTVTEVLGNSLTNAKLYDITRRALDASKRSQQYMDSFVHEAKIGMLVLDGRGMVMITNREAEHYLHVETKDLLGKDIFESLESLGPRGQHLAQAFRSALEDKTGARFKHALDEEPSRPYITVSAFPLFNKQGEVTGAASTFIRQ
jgi:K+-sensing histidine kinase KdpD